MICYDVISISLRALAIIVEALDKSNEIRKVNTGFSKKEISVVKITNDNTYAWINETYLKEFEVDCTFKISSPKSPVFVYEEDELVGLILPVHVKEAT